MRAWAFPEATKDREATISTLAVIFSGDTHYVFVVGGAQHFDIVSDADTGRDLRLNEIAFRRRTAFAGTSACKAQLASIGEAPYAFTAGDLQPIDKAVVSIESGSLPSASALGLLLRKAIKDAGVLADTVNRVIVALEAQGESDEVERYLTDVLRLPTRVRSLEWAFTNFLVSKVASGSGCLLAVLDRGVYVGKALANQTRVVRLAKHDGLSTLREEIEKVEHGSALTAWARRACWWEFINWYSASASRPNAGRFSAYLVDRQLCRRSITPQAADDMVREVIVPALAAGAAAALGLPPRSPMWLLGDDALKLGLRDAAWRGEVNAIKVMTARFGEVASAMATAEPAAPQTAQVAYGLLLRERADAEKVLRVLVDSAAAFPATSRTTLRTGQAGQREFKIDVGTQLPGQAPRLIRQVFFNATSAMTNVTEIEIEMTVTGDKDLKISALDPRTRAPLDRREDRRLGEGGIHLGSVAQLDAISFAPT